MADELPGIGEILPDMRQKQAPAGLSLRVTAFENDAIDLGVKAVNYLSL